MAANPKALAKALIRANSAQQVATGPGGFGGAPPSTMGPSPLVASYGEWAGGRVYETSRHALPRDWQTFLSGSFGPLAPMQPIAIDAPQSDDQGPEPRRSTFPVSWNLPHGVPGDEGLKLASFNQLRTIADTYSVARACIQTRIQEVVGLEWSIVPTPSAEKAMQGDKASRRDFDERRAKLEKFFRKPDPGKFHNFNSWLAAILEDIFVVDALSLYLQPTRAKGKGVLGSNLGALCLIAGDTVRPLLDTHGGIPSPPNPAFQVYNYGVPRVDLMTALSGEDIANMGDSMVAQYRGDQMLYLPYVSRSWTPYGFPPIERALVPILSGIQRQQWQLGYYSDGSTPGIFLSAGDPNASPNQLRELQDALNAMAGDPMWKHKIIVIPQGSKIDPMRPTPLADQFDEIIMSQVCMAFDVMPMEMGISPRVSTTQSPGAANQMAKASESTNERKALKPLLTWLKASIFDFVIQEICGQPDIQWMWEGLEKDEDEQTQVNLLVNEVGHGLRSIDEARIARGEQAWGLPITSVPVYFTGTGVTPIGSVDAETGHQPPPPAPPGTPQLPPGPNGKQPPQPGGPKPAPSGPNGKPAGGGQKPASDTPAHTGAQSHQSAAAKETDNSAQAQMPAKPKPKQAPAAAEKSMAVEPPIAAHAALRELDLIRRRIAKGRTIDGWIPEHIPATIFAALAARPNLDGVQQARSAIKAALPVTKEFHPDQPRDEHGRWSLAGAAIGALEGHPLGGLSVVPGDIAGDYQLLGHALNNDLRQHGGTEQFARLQGELDHEFDHAKPTTEPMVLYRGVGGHAGADRIFGSGNAVGRIVTDPAYMSTSTHEESTEAYGSIEVLVRLHAPIGTRAVRLGGEQYGGAVLGEVLLPRNTRLRVTSDVTDHGGRRVIDALILPTQAQMPAKPKHAPAAAEKFAAKGHPYPGQRYTHGWKPVAEDVVSWRPTMTRRDADVWARGSAIPFDLYHGTSVDNADSIRRNGFMSDKLGTSTGNGGALGAGHYFATGSVSSYGHYGETLTVRAKVKNPLMSDSKDFMRSIAVANYINIYAKSGETAAREFWSAPVSPHLGIDFGAGRFRPPDPHMTNGELIGKLNKSRYAKYVKLEKTGGLFGTKLVQREWMLDQGYDAAVWRMDVRIPGIHVDTSGKSWFEVSVLRDNDLVVVDDAAAKAESPVAMHSALRELDLIRRRLNKGRGLGDWTPEHIPTDVFAELMADLAKGHPYPGQHYTHGWIPTAEGIADDLGARHPDVHFSLGGDTAKAKQLRVSLVRVAEDQRGQGKAEAAMKDLLATADKHGLTVTLTPEPLAGDKRTSRTRLREWYKRLGFVDNKGRTKDYAVSESMYRLPQADKGVTLDKPKAAVAGADALASAPLSFYGGRAKGDLPSEGAAKASAAVGYYKSEEGFRRINASLRNGTSNTIVDRRVAAIDEAMSHSPLQHDVIVWRGVTHVPDANEWTDRAYLSTSVDERTARYFSGEGGDGATAIPVLMQIRVPKGTKALALSKVAPLEMWQDRPGPDLDHEGEMLLGRGLRYRKTANHGIVNGIHRIDVEVLP